MGEVYVYKTSAAELLGITLRAFNKLDLEPDLRVPNPHYPRQKSYLYLKRKIELMKDTPEVMELKNGKRKKNEN